MVKPYVVVWVDPNNKLSTKVNEKVDNRPTRNSTLAIPLPDPINDETNLYVDVVHSATRTGPNLEVKVLKRGPGYHVPPDPSHAPPYGAAPYGAPPPSLYAPPSSAPYGAAPPAPYGAPPPSSGRQLPRL
ncbi:hypothetical protein Gogos_014025, partial [Gossypium gossypioides]|nr:hypothetical protein [Gossypium gossypioides]